MDYKTRIRATEHVSRADVIVAGYWDATDERDPTLDIAAAWSIVDRLPANNLVSVLRHVVGDGVKYSVGISRTNKDGYITRELGRVGEMRSLPLAICCAVVEMAARRKQGKETP